MNIPEWKKNLAVMWFAQLIGMGAITGVMAFLPLYIPSLGVNTVEETEVWAGVLMGVASLAAALAGPHWGAVADRHGRKPMVERVMGVFFVIMVAMGFVTDVYQLLVLRILQGIFGGFTAAALALVTSITPPREIGFTLGIYQTAMIAGGAFGPMFGGLVSDHFGYRQAFIAFGLLCLLSLVIIRFAVTERFVPVARTEKKPLLQEIRGIITVPGLGIILIVQFLIQFSIMNIAPVLPLYIQHLAPDLVYIASTCGAIIAVAGLTSALASAGMGQLSKRFDHRRILLVSAACSAVFFAAQAAASDVLILGIMRGLSGFFLGAMLPTINAVIFLLIPAEKRGVAYGITTGAMQMGNVFGPLTGGTLALYFGIPAVFWVTAGLFAAMAVWVLLYVRNPEPQQQRS
ncbi:MAG: MFS transporter [Negativicutes bacterium]|nr:MFS transporter [Negativicutes bacterium]